MSDASQSEKTEAPTPRRRQEAREKGQIPRSQELTTAVLLLGAALVLNTAGRTVSSSVLSSMKHGLLLTGSGPLDGQSAVILLREMGWKTLAALAVFLTSMAAVALAVTVPQGRGVLTAKPLGPNWERLNPLSNGKRMLGTQPWVELGKSMLKLGLVSLAVYLTMRGAWSETLALAQQAPATMLVLLRRYSVRLLMTAGLAYLVLALLDYLYQSWKHERDLRMSKDEVKREMKESEGDPLLKARMRSMGRALARRQMFQDVPDADVVITNPTHIAVALKYDPETNEAPLVIAMGQRKIAERIKRIASEAGVPQVENRPLARALLGSARVGDFIPPALYLSVAEVLAFVIQQRAVRPSRRQWSGRA